MLLVYRLTLAFFILLAPILPTSLSAQEKLLRVERGQVLELQLMMTLDSSRARVGDRISLQLTNALKAGNIDALPKGQILYGRVTKVRRAGKNCRSGQLEWNLQPASVGRAQIYAQLISEYVARKNGVLQDKVAISRTKT